MSDPPQLPPPQPAPPDPMLLGWTQGEIIRAVERLTHALQAFERSVEERYVPRETYNLELRAIHERLDGMSGWVRNLVAPLISGLIVGIVIAIFTVVLK